MSNRFSIPQTGIGNLELSGSSSPGQSSPQVDAETQKGQALIKQYLTLQKNPGTVQGISVDTKSFDQALALASQDNTLTADQQTVLQKIKNALSFIAGLDGDDKNISDLDLTVLTAADGNSNTLTVQDVDNLNTLQQSGLSLALPSVDDKEMMQQGRLVDLAKQGKLTETTYTELEKLDSATLQKNVANAAAQWDQLDTKQQETLGKVFGDLGLTNANEESTGVAEWIQQNPNTSFSLALKDKLQKRWKIGENGQSAYRNDPTYTKEAGLIEGFLKGQTPNLPAQVDETAAAETAIRQRRSNAGKNGAFAFIQAQQQGKTDETPIPYGDRLDATHPRTNTDAYLSVFDENHDGFLEAPEFEKAFGKEARPFLKAVDAVDGKIDSQGRNARVSLEDARSFVGFLDAGGFQKGQFLDMTILPEDRQAALSKAQTLQGKEKSKGLFSGIKGFFRKLVGKPSAPTSANKLTQVLQNTAGSYRVD